MSMARTNRSRQTGMPIARKLYKGIYQYILLILCLQLKELGNVSQTYISQIDVKILNLKYYFFKYLERNLFFGYFCSRTAAVFFFAVTFHCIPYRTFPHT